MEIIIAEGEQTIITVKGRLDTINAPDFEKAIAPILAGDMKQVIINCAELDYISSSGLRLFLTMQKATNAKQGQLTLMEMKKEIRDIFDMTGFSALFRIT
jgi:anti-anti-sigma factor